MAILQSDEWDPPSLFAPAQHYMPLMNTFPDKIPFGIRNDFIANIPVNPRGTVDIYINNFIGLPVDIEGLDNVCVDLASRGKGSFVDGWDYQVPRLMPLPP